MREGLDQSYGWTGPAGEMLRSLVISGAYRAAIRKDVARMQGFERLAERHSAVAAALADGIG